MSGVALKSSHYQFQPYFMHGYNGAKRDLEVLRKGFMDVENQCSKIRKHPKTHNNFRYNSKFL